MKKAIVFLVISSLICSCKMLTPKDKDELLNQFIGLSMTAKVEYFNSQNTKDKFSILEDYLTGKCFELPISDVIKFQSDGRIRVDWLKDDPKASGLIYASGDKEPFVEYIPFSWEKKDKSLVIIKTEQYQEFKDVRNEGDWIINFSNKELIVYDNVFISIFQNKLYFTISNNQQEVSFLEGSCEKWPVMEVTNQKE
jgi:hypothetical protein